MAIRHFCDQCGKEAEIKLFELEEESKFPSYSLRRDDLDICFPEMELCPECLSSLTDVMERWMWYSL